MEQTQSTEKILEYQQEMHEKNQKRIKYGIRCVLIIPLIFMAVMFALDSNKVVFLVLWIVSLFAISIYLIVVEYSDYQAQMKLSELGIKKDDEIQGLITEPPVVEKVIRNSGLLDSQAAQPMLQVLEDLEAESAERNAGRTSDNEDIIDKTEVDQAFATEAANEQLEQMEAELVDSIKRYVQALGNQAVVQSQQQAASGTKKDAQAYIEMRRAKALEKQEREHK